MGKTKAPVKGTYQHHKGAFYEMLGIADDPKTGKKWVVYESIGIPENLSEGKSTRRSSTSAASPRPRQ